LEYALDNANPTSAYPRKITPKSLRKFNRPSLRAQLALMDRKSLHLLVAVGLVHQPNNVLLFLERLVLVRQTARKEVDRFSGLGIPHSMNNDYQSIGLAV